MNVQKNVPLSSYSTMRIGGPAAYLVDITDQAKIPEAIVWAKEQNLPVLPLGEGANVVFKDDGYPGLVMVVRSTGIEILHEDEKSVVIKAAAGERWDDVVAFAVDRNLSGIEALSAIPGTAGGAPVQNIGAYGQELSDTFLELEAYDTGKKNFTTIPKNACEFRYRDSIFKSTHPHTQKGRYIIVSITLRLSKTPTLKRPLYESLQRFMDAKGVSDTGPESIREVLLEWRSIYLPDPAVIPSNGSFFRNPVIPKQQFLELKKQFSKIKGWPLDESESPMVKLAAAWLVDQATAGKTFNSKLQLHNKQKIVITNPAHASCQELQEFVGNITRLVQEKFGITLEPEPEILP